MSLRRTSLLAALAVTGMTGCVESALNPDDPVAVTGSALNEDKTPLAAADLKLRRSANNLCVLMNDFATLKTGADGAFSHNLVGRDTQNDTDLARCFEIATPAGAGGALAYHDFFIQVTEVKIPALQVWNGNVAAAAASTDPGATVTFKSITDSHGIANPTYGLQIKHADDANSSWWEQAGAKSPVLLSDYVLEDIGGLSAQLTTRGETKGSGTTFHTSYLSDKVMVMGHGKVPASRGATCAFAENQACTLTNGKADLQLAPDNTFEARITLPTAKLLKKAVFRDFRVGASMKNVTIEGSADGTTFVQLAQITDSAKVQAKWFEVDLTGTTAVSVIRVKSEDQAGQPNKLSGASELSFFE